MFISSFFFFVVIFFLVFFYSYSVFYLMVFFEVWGLLKSMFVLFLVKNSLLVYYLVLCFLVIEGALGFSFLVFYSRVNGKDMLLM